MRHGLERAGAALREEVVGGLVVTDGTRTALGRHSDGTRTALGRHSDVTHLDDEIDGGHVEPRLEERDDLDRALVTARAQRWQRGTGEREAVDRDAVDKGGGAWHYAARGREVVTCVARGISSPHEPPGPPSASTKCVCRGSRLAPSLSFSLACR